MKKTKIYKIRTRNEINYNKTNDIKSFVISIIIYAVVLMISSILFEAIEISNFFYAIIAALILSFLNYTIKPFIIALTLPLTTFTLGLCYPIVNIIILWLCSIMLGNNFELNGFFSLFFVSIFISLFKLFLDKIFNNKGV